MDDRKTRRSTYLFVTFLLLAGVAYIYSRSGIPILEALMTSCNYLIYQGLLLFWFQSVRARLLPSRAKNGMISTALLLLLYQLLRVFKYRFATEPTMMRYLIYLIFAPNLQILLKMKKRFKSSSENSLMPRDMRKGRIMRGRAVISNLPGESIFRILSLKIWARLLK